VIVKLLHQTPDHRKMAGGLSLGVGKVRVGLFAIMKLGRASTSPRQRHVHWRIVVSQGRRTTMVKSGADETLAVCVVVF
ncbi:hypothetical protein, partial [Stutzerimonas stutzeri]|uniref:hypothetical protein n=1 Tax=Stutzerimonas stutzeri TaxID=316 RepID=UPI000493E115